jgi:hypothetical protein
VPRTLKSNVIMLRCTEAEEEAWKKAADENGVSLSEFARSWLNWGSERDERGQLKRK